MLSKYEISPDMIRCLVKDEVSVYFDFDKRETIEGHDVCFNHERYIKTRESDGKSVYTEDEIPHVPINICKISFEEAPCECHEFAYQLKFHVIDDEENDQPLLEKREYGVIDLKGVSGGNLVILPGDQIKVALFSQN